MTTLETLSALPLWISLLRNQCDRHRHRSRRAFDRQTTTCAIVVLGLLCALPTWAHHDRSHRHHPHRPELRRDWPSSGDIRSSGIYAELEAGVAALPSVVVHGPFVDGDLDLDSGFVTGGAIGAQLTPFLRVEGAMSYREALVDSFAVEGFVSRDDGSFGAFSTFANAYVDLAIPRSPVTPFVGAGIGVAMVSLETYDPFENVDIDDQSVQLAWNLTAGASWALSEHIDLVTRYRYFATENVDEEYQDGSLRFGEADVELESHEAVVGIRFRF